MLKKPLWIKLQFGLGIFISAFLLFFIQPLLAKALLPGLGGAGFVWVVSMVFFQIGLLVGYFYAYCLTRFFNEKWQAIIHFILLIVSFSFIPLDLKILTVWQSGWPPLDVIIGLMACVFVPFSVIAASSPLLQHWFCSLQTTSYPYYYYSISNIGSLLGLIGYPFLIEAYWGLTFQSQLWSGLYGIYAFVCLLCLIELCFSKTRNKDIQSDERVSFLSIIVWLGLTFLSSSLLVATTRYLTQNVINLPLMWVLPLALYLISYIVTFAKPKGYERSFWIILFIFFSMVCAYLIYQFSLNGGSGVISLLLLLYAGCMICHGELVKAKPPPKHLTLFYLYIALGGALGGLITNGISFLPYAKWWDFYFPLILISLTSIYIGYREFKLSQNILATVLCWGGFIATVAWIVVSQWNAISIEQTLVFEKRSIYGYMRIFDFSYDNPADSRRVLLHGTVLHGTQLSDPHKKTWPTGYFGERTGYALAMNYLRSKLGRPLHVAVIGLGTGTIATLLKRGDEIDYYELDPAIKQIAYHYFSFLSSSPAKVNVIIGDGRVQMNKQLEKKYPPQYDLIIVDAFNGDAIPSHLITQEAMQVYLKLLGPEGIVAFHVTNIYMNLMPITNGLANHFGYNNSWVRSYANEALGLNDADWALLSRDPDFPPWLAKQSGITLIPTNKNKTILWTDDFNSILPLL